MELKFVIPNMEKTFGNLEFAGEDKTEQRRINGRKLVNPRITAEGYKIGTRGFTNYILHADDMVKA